MARPGYYNNMILSSSTTYSGVPNIRGGGGGGLISGWGWGFSKIHYPFRGGGGGVCLIRGVGGGEGV